MRKILFAAAVLSIAAIAGPALAADGAAIYAGKCAACHGKDGKGTPTGQKMGAKDLAKETKEPLKELVEDIEKGKGKMPAFKGKLTPEEIEAVAKYVKAGLK